MKEHIIDVCIDDRWCLVDSRPDFCNRQRFFCWNGRAAFAAMEVRPQH